MPRLETFKAPPILFLLIGILTPGTFGNYNDIFDCHKNGGIKK